MSAYEFLDVMATCPRCGKLNRWLWRIVGDLERQCGACLTAIEHRKTPEGHARMHECDESEIRDDEETIH